MTYQEKPDYLLETTAKATYDYDAKGNRIKYVTDNEDLEYSYDAEDRLLSDGKDDFSYDANGNMTGVKSGEDTVEYVYNAANKLTEVKYPDGTYVKYGYDAFGRKVSREEAYWNKEAGDAPGKSEYAPGQNKEKSNNGNGKGNPNGSSNGNAKGKSEKKNPLKLKTDTTSYLYDGFTNDITNEYTGNGSPLSQYYMANDRVVSKKTFGNHGLVIPGREPSLDTNGGLMYYSYDGMRNVTELTDRHGDSIEEYRYDAFGGLFTGITAPYNTNSFAGKSYDPKANLIDNNARWYQAQTGRFTSADPYRGDMLTPDTQNRYAYVGNNPINRWDPLGYAEDGGTGSWEYFSYERLLREWTETYQDSDTEKGSDGWYTHWVNIETEYKEYGVYGGYTYIYPDGTRGLSDTYYTDYRTDSTVNITYGTDFDPFTAEEWFYEHKDELDSYGNPPTYNPPSAYSTVEGEFSFSTSTDESGTVKFISGDIQVIDTGIRLASANVEFSLGGAIQNEQIKQDAINAGELLLDEVLDEFHPYEWPTPYKIGDFTWAKSYMDKYQREVDRAKDIASFFDTLNLGKTIYDGYSQIAPSTGGIIGNNPNMALATIAGIVVYTVIDKVWSKQPGLEVLPETLGINAAITKDIAKALEKSYFVENSNYEYLVYAGKFLWEESPRSMFVDNINEQLDGIENKSYSIYSTKEENDLYKQELLGYLDTIKDMNINYKQSLSDMEASLNEIDNKYK